MPDFPIPDFPIIDTHLHVWDPAQLSYGWIKGHPLFDRPYHVEDYAQDTAALQTEAMVFVECYADFTDLSGQYLEEVRFVETEAARDPRLRGIVAMAPLEQGKDCEPILAEMAARHPLVKGIRRIMEFDPDPRALTLSDGFIEGVNLLAKYGFHFEINVHHHQMDIIRDFIRHIPDVPLILDHCGKPGIKEGALEQYRSDIKELAQASNLWVKLSGLAVEADHARWTKADLRPYIDATFDTFGFERVIYGGDWPVCLQATTLPRWVSVLDQALSGEPEAQRLAFFRNNANAFYRLGLPVA